MLKYDPISQDQPNDPDYPASMSPVMFESNGCKLLGTMFIAAGVGPHPVIILLHGFPGNEVNYDLAHIFRRQGFNVLVFHYRGCWGSEGDYSWKNLAEDTEASINFIKSDESLKSFRIDKEKIILAGHSMGGFAALYCSIFHDEIKNVVSMAGFNCGGFGEIIAGNKMIFDYSVQTIEFSSKFVNNTSARFLLNELVENKNEWNLLKLIDKLKEKNLLLIASRYDNTAPVEIHHIPLVKTLKENNVKNLEDHILETGHSFSDKRIELSRIILNWLNKLKI